MDRSSSRARRAVLAVLCAGLLAPACARKGGDEEIESAEVPTIAAEVGTVERRDLVEPLLVRGSVVAAPNEDVKLAAQVPGRVVALRLAEGDAVAEGQVVAEIEAGPLADQQRQAQAALAQAKAAQENARLNLERTERLFQKGIAAGKEAEDARAALAAADAGVEQAAAGLDTARHQLGRSQVRSPIAGQVVRRFLNVGDTVDGTPAQPLVEVANLDVVEIAAQVPAQRLERLRPGQKAQVSTEAYPGRSFAGELVAVAPAVDPATNAALVRIRVRNPERLLRVGLSAEARVALQEKKGVLVVPRSALSRSEEGAAVYVVAKGEATRTPVRTGLESTDAVEVVSGLAQGQQVLTSAIQGLGEKARLAARP